MAKIEIGSRQPGAVQALRSEDPGIYMRTGQAASRMAAQLGDAAGQIYQTQTAVSYAKMEAQSNTLMQDLQTDLNENKFTSLNYLTERGIDVEAHDIELSEDGARVVPTWKVAPELYEQEVAAIKSEVGEMAATRHAKNRWEQEFGASSEAGYHKMREWTFGQQQEMAAMEMSGLYDDYQRLGNFKMAEQTAGRMYAAGLIDAKEHQTRVKAARIGEETSPILESMSQAEEIDANGQPTTRAKQAKAEVRAALNHYLDYDNPSLLGVGEQRAAMIKRLQGANRANVSRNKAADQELGNRKYAESLWETGTAPDLRGRPGQQATYDKMFIEMTGIDPDNGNLQPGEIEAAGEFLRSSGVLPTRTKSILYSANFSDIEGLVGAGALYNALQEINPHAFDDVKTDSMKEVIYFAAGLKAGLSPDKIAANKLAWDGASDAEKSYARQILKHKDYDEALLSGLDDYMTGKGGPLHWASTPVGASLPFAGINQKELRASDQYGVMSQEFTALVEMYLQGEAMGSFAIATEMAGGDIAKSWGPTDINGGWELMKNAPSGDRKKIRTQLFTQYGRNMRVRSDANTALAISNGDEPSWVVYRQGGKDAKIPDLVKGSWEAGFEKIMGFPTHTESLEEAQAHLELMLRQPVRYDQPQRWVDRTNPLTTPKEVQDELNAERVADAKAEDESLKAIEQEIMDRNTALGREVPYDKPPITADLSRGAGFGGGAMAPSRDTVKAQAQRVDARRKRQAAAAEHEATKREYGESLGGTPSFSTD